MSEPVSVRREYIIPDNFIEEGRILQGRIKVRNLVEAVLLAFASAFPALIIISNTDALSTQAKITAVIFSAAPGAAAGIAGFNGDSMLTVLKYASKWLKERTTMLLNPSPSLMRGDELEELLGARGAAGRIMDALENARQNRIEKKSAVNLTQGEDFVFESGTAGRPSKAGRGKARGGRPAGTPIIDAQENINWSGELF